MSWLMLLCAGLAEVLWAVGLKLGPSFGKPGLLLITIFGIVLSLVLLTVSLRQLPLGTAYAVWTGIGAVGTFAVSVMFMAEPLTVGKAVSVFLIVGGLLGLRLSSGTP